MAPERVCLAYSGGLDTSTILRWLVLEGYEVVCFLGDCGQEEDFDAVKAKALKLGAEKMIIENVQQELIDDLVWPAIQCNAIYEGQYLLGTSLARPAPQVRFELAWKACDPKMKILAPWRIPAFFNRFQGRADLLKFAKEQDIPVSSTPKAPWSMDDNIIHCSYEAGILEQTDMEPPKDMWKRTVDPLDAPDKPTRFTVYFAEGVPVKLEVGGKAVTGSLEIFKEANELGRANGIGREDIVESRFIGLKSRGCYDTPGLTILRKLHQNLESRLLGQNPLAVYKRGCLKSPRKPKGLRLLAQSSWTSAPEAHGFCSPAFGLVMDSKGMYFTPEREFVQQSISISQKQVDGKVEALAYKGNVIIVGRSSETSNLYSEEESSMDTLEMDWSVEDTTGFINVNAIRIAKYGERKIRDGEPLSKRK
ncbi:hypothetical protein NM208_g8125 [Fusarium decemcellulare]|uniref:Uncharacterized protein n=1 Tax=Fusarium decemcellulare TaxID=57161 RepID=A0ACC1S6L7_9HYPO|nr:hypothetical protein NM208_g8125 [Fusarium decemcellulare]